MTKKLLTYRTDFLLKAIFCLSLFLVMGTTSVMAQFAITEDFRGSGNPDIIIGGPGGTEGTAYLTSGINDPLNAGWLRLTNATTFQKGFAYVNKSFPSTLGVLVDFEYKMWRATNDSYNGADGIGVFLFNAASTFSLGGYGGSLGYAPNNPTTGLAGGYVGVGLDAYGNYANATEGRIGGPGERPNAIVLRGPTTTTASTTNPYLAGKTITTTNGTTFTYSDIASVTGDRTQNALDYNTTTTTRPTDAQFYRRVQLEITRLDAAGIYYNVIVRWKTSPTGAFVYVTDYTTTDVPPALLKLGFAASTGGGINYHEIRNLLVTTPGNLRIVKRADKDILRTDTAGNSTITYTIEVTNDTAFEIPSISFTDRITDTYDNLIAEGTSGFDVTSITTSGFVSAAMPTAASLTTNEITGNLVLAANTTGYITITGRLYTLPNGGLLKNTASAIPPLDEDLNNNTSVVEVPVTSEGVDLLLTKTVSEQCISTPVPTFTVYVSNNGAVGQSFTRIGANGTRIGFSIVVPSGYTYTDTTPGGLAGIPGPSPAADPQNSNVTARWSRVTFANTPSAGFTTYYYTARGTDAAGAAQTLGAGMTYPYPVTYTMQPPVGTTSFIDTSTARLFTNTNYGTSTEPAENLGNNDASITMYVKPPAPTVSGTALNYCVDEDAPELTATKTNSAYTLRWYMTPGGFSSEFPIKPETAVAGTYTYYVSQVNGDCEGPTASITVNVGPTNVGTISAPASTCPGNSVTISGDVVTGATYSWESAVEGGTWSTISGATTRNYTTPVLNQTMYYRRLVTITANGKTCTGPGSFVKVFVASAGIIGNSQAQCNNFNPGEFSNVTSGTNGTVAGVTGTYSYQWQISTDGTTWTGGSNGDISGATSETYDPPSNINSTRYYRRLVKFNSTTCAISNVVVAYVGPNNSNTVNQGGIGNAQTICYGETPATLNSTFGGAGGTGYYQWLSSTTSATANDFVVIPDASPTTGSYSPGALTQTTWFRRRKLNGCNNSTAGVTLEITVLNPTPGTIGTTQTICYNSPAATLIGTAGSFGSQYRWEMAEGTSGGTWGTAPGTSNTQNYTPVGNLTTSKRFRRFTTSISGLTSCESVASNIVTIIVKAQTNPGTISSSQTICNGGTPSTLTGTPASGDTGSSGSITYRWQVSTTTTADASFSDITPAVTTANYSPGALTATRHYRRIAVVSSGVGSPCETATVPVTVTVQAVPARGTITGTSTVCYGSNVTIGSSDPGSGSGTLSYRWEANPASAGYATVPGQTGVTLTVNGITQTTVFRRYTISTLNGNPCESVATTTITITVRPEVIPGQLDGDQTICYNTQPAVIGSTTPGSGGAGTISYAWQSNSGSGWSGDISGANGPTYQPPVLTGTTMYRRFAIAATGSCRSLTAATVTITVQTVPVAGSITGTATVCSGSNVTIGSTTPGNGDGGITYRWEAAPVSTGVFATIAGSGETLAVNNITVSTIYRRYTISTLNGRNCESVATGTVTITINNTFVDPGQIGTSQVVCSGNQPPTITTTTASSNAWNYVWEYSIDGGASWITNTSQTSSSYFFSGPITQTTQYRRYGVRDCKGTTASNIVTMTVPAIPDAGTIGTTQLNVCRNSLPALLTSVSDGSGGTGYQWQISDSASGPWSDISGATSTTYQSGPVETKYFRRVTLYSGGTCVAPTNVVQITSTVTMSAGAIVGDQTICSNVTPSTITSSDPGYSGSYRWDSSPDGTTWTSTGVTTQTYSFSAPLGTTTYYRRAMVGTTCAGEIYSNTIIKTILPAAVGGTAAANQSICNGATPAMLTVTGSSAGTYRWDYSTTSATGPWNTTGVMTADYTPGALVQTTYYRRATISASCGDAYSTTVTITVQAAVNGGTASSNQNICNGDTTSTLTVTGSTSGAVTYRWEKSTTNLAGSWGPAGGTAVDFNPGTLVQTTYFRRATISGSCEGFSSVVTITVSLPVTAGSITGTQTICMDTAPTILGSATVGLGTGSPNISYRWEVSANGSTGWTTIAGATDPTYQPLVLHATRHYRRYTVSTSTVGGITATCESGPTGTVVVTTKNCKVITNPMVRSRVN